MMMHTLAIENYRSLLSLRLPLGRLNVIVGANGTGKSNLYRAMKLLADTAQSSVVNAVANEGGLDSALWAGPETISKAMREGNVPVQGTVRRKSIRLNLGFYGDDYGYAIALGKPLASPFLNETLIRRETIWAGGAYKPSKVIAERTEHVAQMKAGRNWQILSQDVAHYHSIFHAVVDPVHCPEIVHLRNQIQQWRFYDHFRTDSESPARQPQLGTMTPVVSHDGRDLAAALMTIAEIGDIDKLHMAIERAFPDTRLVFNQDDQGQVSIGLQQHGLLRSLSARELSEGTLRYLFWVAALLSPRPAPMIVLNEPETSLHPDLLPALAELIIQATGDSQVWVVSHANRLVNALSAAKDCEILTLEKPMGTTQLVGQDLMSEPSWKWPPKF